MSNHKLFISQLITGWLNAEQSCLVIGLKLDKMLMLIGILLTFWGTKTIWAEFRQNSTHNVKHSNSWLPILLPRFGRKVFFTCESRRCGSSPLWAERTIVVAMAITLVGNSTDPPSEKFREPILHYIIYCFILGNNKRPIDLSRIVKTGRKWSKLVKTGQNWSKVVKTGQNRWWPSSFLRLLSEHFGTQFFFYMIIHIKDYNSYFMEVW